MKRPLVFLIGAFISVAAFGQSGQIPPLVVPERTESLQDQAFDKTLEKAASEIPGATMKGAATINSAMGNSGSVLMMKNANNVGEIVSKGLGAVNIISATVKEGQDGFMREGSQFVVEQSVDGAANFLVKSLAGAAVSGGASAMTAFGVAGLSYTGGTVIGTYIRNDTSLGQRVGLPGSIGSSYDNWLFTKTPDSFLEALSGTKQVHFDSPEYQAQMQDDLDRRRREMSFNRVAAENQEQQRQLDALNANAPGPSNAADPSDPSAAGLGSFMASLPAYSAPRSSTAPAGKTTSAVASSCTPAKVLDTKTGCHPGHDEKNHPGGCKCGGSI